MAVLSVFEIIAYAIFDLVISEAGLVMLRVVCRGGRTHSPERPVTVLRVMRARRGFVSA